MKFCIQLLLISLFSQNLISQVVQQEYARVKVDMTTTDIRTISSLGIETDHGVYAKGKHFINDFSTSEIVLLEDNDIPFTILIPDMASHYVNQNQHTESQNSGKPGDVCDPLVGGVKYDYKTPDNYMYGSMGGYLTYSELLVELDKMATMYPDLITPVAPIGDIQTHMGNLVQWLRVSDNAATDEDEPEVLYTALHHAREPNSLSQMVFYLWYLLENYETDAEIKYLVDNTEMYFIPVVNPDGYLYNEETNPEGGGLWRKNRMSIGDIVFGVDLNRNYGYEWGFDDQGSSPNPESNVYRGESGFSEPETQAVREFCNDHNFRLALNYHTYGNLLIYPWGFSDSESPDHSIFRAFSDVMSQENDYFAGTGTETVGYVVNGDSDDWMYGEAASKPPIFAMTPEVGEGQYGFWPPQTEIDRLNKSALLQNLVTAHLLLNYAEVEDQQIGDDLTSMSGNLDLILKKYGLEDGELITTISALTDNILFPADEAVINSPQHLEEISIQKSYTLSENIEDGDEVKILVEVDHGEFLWTDTLTKVYGNSNFMETYLDSGNNISAWTVDGNWGETDERFVSSPSSYTDSPNEDYAAGREVTMDLSDPIDLEGVEKAALKYFARWDIEEAYDYAQIMASRDRVTYIPLCGHFTNAGTNNQDPDQPLYDSSQDEWVQETVDLTDYAGESVYIRFRLVSDNFVEGEGFFFDDLTVNVVTENSTNVIDLSSKVIESRVVPNPTSDKINIEFQLTESLRAMSVEVYNTVGQMVQQKELQTLPAGVHKVSIPNQGLEQGIYLVRVNSGSQVLVTKRVVRL